MTKHCPYKQYPRGRCSYNTAVPHYLPTNSINKTVSVNHTTLDRHLHWFVYKYGAIPFFATTPRQSASLFSGRLVFVCIFFIFWPVLQRKHSYTIVNYNLKRCFMLEENNTQYIFHHIPDMRLVIGDCYVFIKLCAFAFSRIVGNSHSFNVQQAANFHAFCWLRRSFIRLFA